jgi:flagellar protein FliL
MSAKTENKEALAAPESGGAEKAAVKPEGPSVLQAWIPAIIAVLIAPAASWAVAQFAVLPHFRQALQETPAVAAPGSASGEAKAESKGESKGGKKGADEGPPTYAFDNVVVNLAGTMGTRYLKTSFIVTGADADIKTIFTEKKALLTDVTINVLSSLTLSDLEEPGSKNVLREKLIVAYNQALGRRVATQVYFSDFVVQ